MSRWTMLPCTLTKKTYSVELFEKLTESKVVGFPPQIPTAAPTYPVGPGFTNGSLKTAVNDWIANKPATLHKYGDIKYWGTSEVTSMSRLFEGKITFNEDLIHWDTSNTTDLVYSMVMSVSGIPQMSRIWDICSGYRCVQ